MPQCESTKTAPEVLRLTICVPLTATNTMPGRPTRYLTPLQSNKGPGIPRKSETWVSIMDFVHTDVSEYTEI